MELRDYTIEQLEAWERNLRNYAAQLEARMVDPTTKVHPFRDMTDKIVALAHADDLHREISSRSMTGPTGTVGLRCKIGFDVDRGRGLYSCNRFPSWGELTNAERQAWNKKYDDLENQKHK
jgi:hypothetical protein